MMSGPVSREDAWALLIEFTQSDSLRKHALAVEAAMRACARDTGADEELWGVTGLLHDFDYERWPNPERDETGHPWTGVAILRERGYSEEMCDAILGHAPFTKHPRTTPLAKTLFAVDELCGLITAIGYVRPDGLDGLEPKSVKKKLKDKAFARGVSREDVRQGMAELGVDENAHIARVIAALQSIAAELGF
ncbi:MAG: HDIG domain-containing metalloprotein [Candidatus Hydrogenedentales bacterium]